jgi:tetratricopeptide (TPR) repeat protein
MHDPQPVRTRTTRRRRRARAVLAAALTPALLTTLSLGACAGESGLGGAGPGPLRMLSRALDTNLSLLDPPPGGPLIEGGSASGSYLAGRFALESGEYARAADDLDRALAADPENLELRRQVFLLRLASGDFAPAVAAAGAIVEIDGSADEPLLLLALDRARAGDFAAARELLQRIGERGAVGLVTPILDAWAAFGAGAVGEALARLGDGGGGDDQGLDLLRRYHRALMLDLAGRPAEALALLEGAGRPPPDGAPAPAAARPLRITQTLVQLRLDTGDRGGAERLVAEAQAADPDDPQLEALAAAVGQARPRLVPVTDPATGMADALVGIGEALLEQEAGAQALLLARAAEFLAPRMADAQLLVGRVLLGQGNAAAAALALERVPASAPQSWLARQLRAQALRELGRTEEAVRLLRAMADERPRRADALVALGDLHRRDERFAEAEAAYAEAIRRLPAVGREAWRLLYARGMALERLKRWDEAEAALKRALELEPDQPLVLNYLGYSWVDQGRNLDEAKAMLHKAVELRPEDGFIVDSLGWAYFRLGEFEKAATYLERAVELEPGDPVINDHLGDAYWRVGRVREARFQWQRALSLKPEPDVASQIETKLARGLPEQAGAGPTRG